MTSPDQDLSCRHFISYTGVKLPLQLVSPLDDETLDGRITFFRGYYDKQELLTKVEKVVYGEIEFEHRYEYHNDGRLKRVEMIEGDDDKQIMTFD